ncbi:MAG: tryptophan halogenase [Proteobacteria bacterium]|nr:tryptophan halogenase [Pseudomonadota bacterium]
MSSEHHFDVVIMGGGIGGNMQARHLLRTIPGIKVAVIDPRSDERIASVHKIGESTVEIAAIFMSQELGLVDYLLENHPPKCGLAFHWAKEAGQTDTLADDYFSIWPPRFPKVMTWQIHRGTFERDLTAMNRADGVHWFMGKVKAFEVGAGDLPNTVRVKGTHGGEDAELSCDHLVDAAGRAWLTGKKFDNIRQDAESLYGLNTGAAWVRVKGVDPELFQEGGADGERVATSQFYATNHWMGEGHWLWQIPICTETHTVSVGGMFHHDIIPGAQVGRKEKLLDFIKANHHALWKMIDSADEVVDFIYWKKPTHLCKKMFSSDNWYAIGDAAYFGDAFYSLGISTVAIAVTSTTELIRAKMADEPDVETKREWYDKFNVYFGETALHLYRDHDKHTGHASAMSWRIYLEYMWWFGMWVPMFIGRWHLDVEMCQAIVGNCEKPYLKSFYDDLTRMIEQGGNAGLMDPYRADQLIGGYHPTTEHVHFLEDAEFAPGRLDLYASLSKTYMLNIVFLLKFQWRAFGLLGVLSPRTLRRVAHLLRLGIWIKMGSWRHKFRQRKLPANAKFAKQAMEFQGYAGTAELQDWSGKEPPEGAKKADADAAA